MFKVGDKVRIKECTYDTPELYWLSSMDKFHGIETVIKETKSGNSYFLEKGSFEDGSVYVYHEDWLEQVEETEYKIDEKDIEDLLCLK